MWDSPFLRVKANPTALWVRLFIKLKANCLPWISFALVKGQSYEVGIEEATPTALVGYTLLSGLTLLYELDCGPVKVRGYQLPFGLDFLSLLRIFSYEVGIEGAPPLPIWGRPFEGPIGYQLPGRPLTLLLKSGSGKIRIIGSICFLI